MMPSFCMSSVSRRSCSSNSAFFSGPSASCRFRSTQFRSFRIAFGFARHFSSGVMRPIAEPYVPSSQRSEMRRTEARRRTLRSYDS